MQTYVKPRTSIQVERRQVPKCTCKLLVGCSHKCLFPRLSNYVQSTTNLQCNMLINFARNKNWCKKDESSSKHMHTSKIQASKQRKMKHTDVVGCMPSRNTMNDYSIKSLHKVMNKIIAIDVVYAPSLPLLLVNLNFNLNVSNPTFFPSVCCSLATRKGETCFVFVSTSIYEGR